MAELLGTIAGGAGLASLVIQVLENTRKLADLHSAIRDAPKEIGAILEEINILANVLLGFSKMQSLTEDESSKPIARIFTDTLRYCKLASQHLSAIVSELDVGMTSQPKRFSVKVVLRKKKLEALLFRLERAKSTLALAQILCLQLLQNRSCENHQIHHKVSVEALRAKENLDWLTASEAVDYGSSLDESTVYNVGIGTFRIRRRHGSMDSHGPGYQELHFLLAPRFSVYGISVIIKRQFGMPQILLQPLRMVPGDSLIMKACAMGATEEVRRLITTKKASPWDTTPDGITPLHVAAAWLWPETCKVLLELGAEAAAAVRASPLSWTPLALAAERAGFYRTWLFPSLEHLRPGPEAGLARMRETMRILLDDKKSEVHYGYSPGKRGVWNGSRSTLHGFRGSAEDYQWLARQEVGIESIDSDPDDYKASIVLQQTQMFPNFSFMISLNQITNMVHLANFRNSKGYTLLHYLMYSGWGSEPGVWMNGTEVFMTLRALLQHGADPSAQNSIGQTPLMYAAHMSMKFLSRTNKTLTCTEASTKYSKFLERWVSVLRTCKINLEDYCLREQRLGAGSFTPSDCWCEVSHPLGIDEDWYVRVCFEVDPNRDVLSIKFDYQKMRRGMMIPGAWID